MIDLQRGVSPREAISVLTMLSREASNIRGGNRNGFELLAEWRQWSVSARGKARQVLGENAVQTYVSGPQFPLLHSLSPSSYGAAVSFLVDAELADRVTAIDAAVEAIRAEMKTWGSGKLAVIIDTNVILRSGPRLSSIAWDDVVDETVTGANFVIPIQVVEELDALKDRGSGDQRQHARIALKWLDEQVPPPSLSATFATARTGATLKVWVDDLERVPLATVDRDIIGQAVRLQQYAGRVVIASMDRSMLLRARMAGLDARLMESAAIPERDLG